jgi:hypothetical protein
MKTLQDVIDKILLSEYPTGEVVGPCVCGSWPGGNCLRCKAEPVKCSKCDFIGTAADLNRIDSDLPTCPKCGGLATTFVNLSHK